MSKKYLVTGRAGSGKTEVNIELNRRGYASEDTDTIPDLARWVDLKTGEKVQVDSGSVIDDTVVDWNWEETKLRTLLESNKELFLCGSAGNQLAFHDLFDEVFVLSLDPETQKARLSQRHSLYGKDPVMQERIVKQQQEFVVDALNLGAIAIDSDKPIVEVVDSILEVTHAN
jgi:dephospho-CoA kinase